jgi:hypothetical protein
MAVTSASLKTRFPKAFPASFDDAVLTAAIAEAEALNDATVWGSKYDLAVQYHAASLALADEGAVAAAGGIAQAKAGSVSVTYAQDAAVEKDRFWAQYQRLQRSCFTSAFVSGVC